MTRATQSIHAVLLASIRTFPVLAAAYRGKRKRLDNLLTHACVVNAEGSPVRVLCGRAKLESICDQTQATDEPPTCAACKERLEP